MNCIEKSKMNRILSKIFDRLFFKKWIIGVCRGNLKDIIRSKTFDPNIHWFFKSSTDSFYADPFLLTSKDEIFKILLEEYSFDEHYGKISLMTVDKRFKQKNYKVLLDTKSHLSYPFAISENNKTYIFPESRKNGKLSCYEYDPVSESVIFLKNILDLPLFDSTILKYHGKYWIFATLYENVSEYKLHVFFSDNLLGPYIPHPSNPVKGGLNGTRSAGNFIEVDGMIYRPTQNCEEEYGKSITINKVTELNELNVVEELYMTICINKRNINNFGMHTIHTINAMDDLIVVDGIRWTFSPIKGLKDFIIDRINERQLKKLK
jgi:hypothetical protein